ncbi:MAG: hypothetical protein AB7I27_05570 [Bacteriovoracaceae bacterium]
MKLILLSLLALFLISCGDKKSSSSSSGISSDPLKPSTVQGYLISTGGVEINGAYYQMASSLTSSEINQKIMMSGVQPTVLNGAYKYRARLTGAIFNPCNQQSTTYNPNYCTGGQSSNLFYVSDIQFY